MMASQFTGSTLQGGRNAFDAPVAALAGLSVAFAVFAAPADLLAELIGSSGLGSVLPAAEPPLGMNARIGIGAAGAVVMFAFAFLLLRWLDRFGRRRTERAEDAEFELEMPRMRRRDFHPDAPPRAPLFAASELGEPEPEPEPEPAPQAEPGPEPPRPRRSWLPEPAPAADPPEPVAAEPASIEPVAIESIEPEPVTVEPPARASSIGELLERLEQGLARRRVDVAPPTAPAAPAPVAVPPARNAAPPVFPEPADDRLRSAIDSLQRLASRQD